MKRTYLMAVVMGLTLALLAGSSNAATYYVAQNAPGASNSNPGTEASPWLTIFPVSMM